MSNTEPNKHKARNSGLLVCAIALLCAWFFGPTFWPTEPAVEVATDSMGRSDELIVTSPVVKAVVTTQLSIVSDELEKLSDKEALNNQSAELIPNQSLNEIDSELRREEFNDVLDIAPSDIDPQELNSLLKVDINYMIEQWRQSWQVGDAPRYLSFYSSQFVPAAGAALADWQRERESRVSPTKPMKLTLSNFSVELEDGNSKATVIFDQFYESGDVSDQVRKQLVLIKTEEWRIIAETVLK